MHNTIGSTSVPKSHNTSTVGAGLLHRSSAALPTEKMDTYKSTTNFAKSSERVDGFMDCLNPVVSRPPKLANSSTNHFESKTQYSNMLDTYGIDKMTWLPSMYSDLCKVRMTVVERDVVIKNLEKEKGEMAKEIAYLKEQLELEKELKNR